MDYYFLGDEELLIAFNFIGVRGTAVKDRQEASSLFRKITEGSKTIPFEMTNERIVLPDDFAESADCRVLIITEEVALWLDDFLIDWQLSGCYPLIVEIPGIAGRLEGRKTLSDLIRESIGIHV